MSEMYEPGYDYFHEPTEFEQEVDSFKEALRGSVKKEIADELEKLRATVKEQGEKLKNLAALEAAAKADKKAYEWKMGHAERFAMDKVKKEGIRKLLDVLAEPRYRIDTERRSQPKCNKCNEDRKLEYTTPRGRVAYEPCECAATTLVWVVEEQLVHEITKRYGELIVWYTSTAHHYNRDNADSISSGTVLKSPANVPLKELMDEPRWYGFTNKEDALVVASALNKEKPEEAASWV